MGDGVICGFKGLPTGGYQKFFTIIKLEQFHFEIALAAARADARREGVSAIYLRG
ncbi:MULTISPECIES: hypothetical protein [unclassified Desulfovibrio]|uniref:hypothetical protein n=1 Tax=unclassified Desulfovibrio TaxID=2593640 RepID=UPI002FD93621